MRILYLSSWYPFPPDNGSKIRAYHLLKFLSRNHEVALISFYNPGEPPESKSANTFCTTARLVPNKEFNPRRLKSLACFLSTTPRSIIDTYSLEMSHAIEQELALGKYDGVIASQIRTACYIKRALVPCIFEEVENSVILESSRKGKTFLARFRRLLTWQKTSKYTARLIRKFSAVTVVSEKERMLLKQIDPGYSNVYVIPNGAELEMVQPCITSLRPKSLIYNGSLTYQANYDAVNYFLSDIWPLVRATEPNITFKVTGKTDGVDLQGLPIDERTILTGYLPSVKEAVSSAWVCVVPLRIGGGTRLKILEAMAVGTPVVSTSKGAEGLDVTPGENILVADTPENFARLIVQLLTDSELWHRISLNGRRLVEEKYDWKIIGRKFVDLIESVVAEKSGC